MDAFKCILYDHVGRALAKILNGNNMTTDCKLARNYIGTVHIATSSLMSISEETALATPSRDPAIISRLFSVLSLSATISLISVTVDSTVERVGSVYSEERTNKNTSIICSCICNKIFNSFEHGCGFIPPVGKFYRGHSPRVIFPKGGVTHNHGQKSWIFSLYHSYSTTPCNILRTAHRF